MTEQAVRYLAPPTLWRFMSSDHPFRIAVGPFGSGKSSACVMELLKRAQQQDAGKDGIRRSRFAVVRNTYPQLRDATRKTFEQWVPQQIGSWRERDFTFEIHAGDVQSEIVFRALDSSDSIGNLLSVEYTGAYVNEIREMSKEVIDALTGRVGRYKPEVNGPLPNWSGIWADSNPWHTRHWLHSLDKAAPGVLEIHRQPSGRSEHAENVENLKPDYYRNMVAGKDAEWVKVYVDGEDASTVVGSIYGELLTALEREGRVGAFEHGNGGVFTSWDLGRTDSTAIWFWRVAARDEIEVIDCYESHLQPLSHYLDVVEARGYEYVKHWLPHDARARTLASEMGSVEDQMRKRWPGKVEIGPGLSILDGLTAARWMLEGRVRFHPRCAKGLEALQAYRREWDADARAYGQNPVHDWSSNYADAFRYLAVVVRATEMITLKPEKPAPKPIRSLADFSLTELFEAREQQGRKERI